MKHVTKALVWLLLAIVGGCTCEPTNTPRADCGPVPEWTGNFHDYSLYVPDNTVSMTLPVFNNLMAKMDAMHDYAECVSAQ